MNHAASHIDHPLHPTANEVTSTPLFDRWGPVRRQINEESRPVKRPARRPGPDDVRSSSRRPTDQSLGACITSKAAEIWWTNDQFNPTSPFESESAAGKARPVRHHIAGPGCRPVIPASEGIAGEGEARSRETLEREREWFLSSGVAEPGSGALEPHGQSTTACAALGKGMTSFGSSGVGVGKCGGEWVGVPPSPLSCRPCVVSNSLAQRPVTPLRAPGWRCGVLLGWDLAQHTKARKHLAFPLGVSGHNHVCIQIITQRWALVSTGCLGFAHLDLPSLAPTTFFKKVSFISGAIHLCWNISIYINDFQTSSTTPT